ncbi:MAG TPA: hypothetical protein VGO67_25925 [Verrucomicrobiae bacterium]|jgi:hypothetical protein
MSRAWKILFAFSGVLVLLGALNSPALLPYPLFVLAYLCDWRLPLIKSPAVRLLLSTMLCTFMLECCAWLNEYVKNTAQPALFHPQLIPDLLLSIGVYAAWWLTWWLALRFYRFTTRQVFFTTGLYGVLIEQQGKIFIAGLQTMPKGAVLWLFIFVVYGSTMALAFFLVRDSFVASRDHWIKFPLAWIALFIFTFATSIIWGFGIGALHIILPKKLPLRTHPFW